MDLSKFSVNKLRTELWTCHILSEQRRLFKACEWAEDVVWALPEDGEEKLISRLEKELNDGTVINPKYEHAKACFDLHEYDRAAYLVKDQMKDDKSRFLHFFSKYKAAEKKRIDIMNEPTINIPRKAQNKFNELRDSLERSMDSRAPDGWLLYVHALVLHKFGVKKTAIKQLERAINMTPINWSAWYTLTILIDDKDVLHSLELPNHLFKVFFYKLIRQHLDMSDEEPWILVGQKETKTFIEKYFKNSLFIKTLAAKSLGYQSYKYEEALETFAQIRQEDPCRIDGMEVYSNLLYVRKMRKEVATLAYEIEKVDPMTSEANCCIANSYSAREQHLKAIQYFTRALRINPDSSNTWTLIGHEYLEVKSIDKALQAYRFAIAINKRDCRAWLGLGNTYETIMSSPNVTTPNYELCLYYYSQVGKYRPKDQIMFIAMGGIYEKLNDLKMAIICYKQAGREGLIKLSRLYESNDMRQEAAELSANLSM